MPKIPRHDKIVFPKSPMSLPGEITFHSNLLELAHRRLILEAGYSIQWHQYQAQNAREEAARNIALAKVHLEHIMPEEEYQDFIGILRAEDGCLGQCQPQRPRRHVDSKVVEPKMLETVK